MTESEALKWISISFVIYYTIGTSLSLYVAQRYILKNQSKKKIALFALVYLSRCVIVMLRFIKAEQSLQAAAYLFEDELEDPRDYH